MRKAVLTGAVLMGSVLGLAVCGGAAAAAAAQDWLSLCGKCLSPSVYSKSSIGTANAAALARITRQDAQGWCENWEPGRVTDCVREQMDTPEARREYRATADCTAGRITPVDGKTYRLNGVWPRGSMGEGRSRWRNAGGRVVGADNVSGGLGISQQWEVLCPNATRAAARPAAPLPGRRRRRRPGRPSWWDRRSRRVTGRDGSPGRWWLCAWWRRRADRNCTTRWCW